MKQKKSSKSQRNRRDNKNDGRPGKQERQREERKRRFADREERQRKLYSQDDDQDFAAFSDQLQAEGFAIQRIIGDGNCLFRSLAHQLEQDESLHDAYRQAIVAYMRSHREQFEPFLDLDDVTFEDHVTELSDDGVYAGNDSIVAFARHYQRDVIIHQFNAPAFAVSAQIDGVLSGSKDEIHLAYHGHDYQHYSSLLHIDESVNNPPAADESVDESVDGSVNNPPAATQTNKSSSLKTGKNMHLVEHKLMDTEGGTDALHVENEGVTNNSSNSLSEPTECNFERNIFNVFTALSDHATDSSVQPEGGTNLYPSPHGLDKSEQISAPKNQRSLRPRSQPNKELAQKSRKPAGKPGGKPPKNAANLLEKEKDIADMKVADTFKIIVI